jgi:PAS domain S-box-containing protein
MSRNISILILEDRPTDAELALREVRKAGIPFTAKRVMTESEFKAELKSDALDIILADHSLPSYDGSSALKLAIKERPDVPFIFVSGTLGEETAIDALHHGATDYVLKQRLGRLGPAVRRALHEAEERRQLRQAQQELLDSAQLYHSLVENLPQQICRKDLSGRFTFANRHFCQALGKPLEEIVGRNDADFFPKDLAERYRQEESRICGTGEVLERVEEHQGPDGHKRFFEVFKTPLRSTTGQVIGVQAIFWDVTERHRAEEALRQSEQFRKAILDAIPVGVWFMNSEFEVQFSNRFDATLWNGQASVSLDHVSDYNSWWAGLMNRVSQEKWAVCRCVTSGFSICDELHEVACFDGKSRTILHSAVPLANSDGEILGAIAINHDITERQRSENRIREQANLLDLTDDVICVRDLDGRILYWNKGAERLLGWTAAEVTGQPIEAAVLAENPWFDQNCVKHAIEHGSWNGELKRRTQAEKTLVVQSRWTLLKDGSGQPQSILVVETDITERKNIEAQFLRAQRLESIGQLAGGIAHDLNNILTPIMVGSSLVRGEISNPDTQSLLDMIESNAKRGSSIIKQLLVFSRGAQGSRAPLSPARLINEFCGIIRETFPKSIAFQTKVDPDVRMVNGDETQLHQILLNLCVNARDAMPNGGTLTISAENIFLDERNSSTTPEAKPGQYVLIRVVDTGMGISPSVVERIFDPFFTTKGPDRGTGLGLSTVLGIVKGHSGFIKVQSKIGRGTQFEVFLPSSLATHPPLPEGRSSSPVAGRKETILVIDDESNIRDVVRRTLEGSGYRVLTAENGAEAITIYSRHHEEIQVVVADMMMPIMDGPSAILVLRRKNPHLKIIATSGVEPSRQQEARSLGVHAFLSKPFPAETLLATLSEVLARADQ